MNSINDLIPIVVAIGVPAIVWAITLQGSVRAMEARLLAVEQKLERLSELIELRQYRVRAGDAKTSGSHGVGE